MTWINIPASSGQSWYVLPARSDRAFVPLTYVDVLFFFLSRSHFTIMSQLDCGVFFIWGEACQSVRRALVGQTQEQNIIITVRPIPSSVTRRNTRLLFSLTASRRYSTQNPTADKRVIYSGARTQTHILSKHAHSRENNYRMRRDGKHTHTAAHNRHARREKQ